MLIVNKIKFIIKTKISEVNNRLGGIHFAWSYILVTGFMIFVIVTLGLNIVSVYQRGKRNLDQIILEREKLEELQLEGQELEEELAYRQSLQFVESYAHDNLYLGRLGERLYKIDRDSNINYEVQDVVTNPIELEDNSYWWSAIFLW